MTDAGAGTGGAAGSAAGAGGSAGAVDANADGTRAADADSEDASFGDPSESATDALADSDGPSTVGDAGNGIGTPTVGTVFCAGTACTLAGVPGNVLRGLDSVSHQLPSDISRLRERRR